MRIGCIADDLTGATDWAGMFASAGLEVIQFIGAPQMRAAAPEADAIVVALKSRTAPVAEAVAESLEALAWLRQAGCDRIFFKYCSTFDSSPRGNIGPVADALLDATGAAFTVACPAFPKNGRTVFQGHLFVGSQLLSESSMRNHPLTPMTDSDLVRVLQAQTPRRVGLAPLEIVRQGEAALRQAFKDLEAQGCAYAVVDAVEDEDLLILGRACADMAVVTGGSGLGMGLVPNLEHAAEANARPPGATNGPRAVIAGSCSAATQRQVAAMKAAAPAFQVDPLALRDDPGLVEAALAFADAHLGDGPILIYATAGGDEVRAAQAALGVEAAGALVEDALARIAQGLVQRGVRRLIVAGGETSGAVVKALGVPHLRIGPQIDPGVPWTHATLPETGAPIALALKSGNFGADDMFLQAWTGLDAWEKPQ